MLRARARDQFERASPRVPGAPRSQRYPVKPSFRRSRLVPAGTRHPVWRRCRSTTPRSAASTFSSVNGSASASASRAARSRSAPPSPRITRSNAAGSSAGPSNRNETSGQNSSSVWIFSPAISAASARPDTAGELLEPASELLVAELAQVDPVHVPELALVEHGRVLRDALEPEALGELGQGEDLLVGREARPRAARCSCRPPRGGSRPRGAPAPTPRRDALRACGRRGRAAAAGARSGAARRRAPRTRAAAWECSRGGPRRGRRA